MTVALEGRFRPLIGAGPETGQGGGPAMAPAVAVVSRHTPRSWTPSREVKIVAIVAAFLAVALACCLWAATRRDEYQIAQVPGAPLVTPGAHTPTFAATPTTPTVESATATAQATPAATPTTTPAPTATPTTPAPTSTPTTPAVAPSTPTAQATPAAAPAATPMTPPAPAATPAAPTATQATGADPVLTVLMKKGETPPVFIRSAQEQARANRIADARDAAEIKEVEAATSSVGTEVARFELGKEGALPLPAGSRITAIAVPGVDQWSVRAFGGDPERRVPLKYVRGLFLPDRAVTIPLTLKGITDLTPDESPPSIPLGPVTVWYYGPPPAS